MTTQPATPKIARWSSSISLSGTPHHKAGRAVSFHRLIGRINWKHKGSAIATRLPDSKRKDTRARLGSGVLPQRSSQIKKKKKKKRNQRAPLSTLIYKIECGEISDKKKGEKAYVKDYSNKSVRKSANINRNSENCSLEILALLFIHTNKTFTRFITYIRATPINVWRRRLW